MKQYETWPGWCDWALTEQSPIHSQVLLAVTLALWSTLSPNKPSEDQPTAGTTRGWVLSVVALVHAFLQVHPRFFQKWQQERERMSTRRTRHG